MGIHEMGEIIRKNWIAADEAAVEPPQPADQEPGRHPGEARDAQAHADPAQADAHVGPRALRLAPPVPTPQKTEQARKIAGSG